MKSPVSAVCVGDNCVDNYLPPLNHRYIGGNAVNVAVRLCKSGVPAAYVGVVGNDADGKLTLFELQAQHVDISHTRIIPGQTATSHILLTNSKERQFVYEYLGPQPVLELDEGTLQFICGHGLIHNTMSGGAEAYLARFHQLNSAIVSMDYGERSQPDFISRTLSHIDWAFFSMEADQRGQAEMLARSTISKGPSLVVVTLGSGGSIAYNGSMFYQPATVTEVVDTLGAGDAYIGTFLANRLGGLDLTACMQQASITAAQACMHYGGWEQGEKENQ
jgi:fructoselysine 6-kinase